MKRNLILLLILFSATSLYAHDWNVNVGPHFNYMRLKFDEPDHVDGYTAGITTGIEYNHSCFAANLDFEGTWDTNYLRGDNCQKSSIEEYFLELKIGPQFTCLCDNLLLSPYIGFGWHRFLNEQYPDTISLCYRYDKLFIPVGFSLDYCLFPFIESSLQFEWRPDVYSKLQIDSTQVDTNKEHAFRLQIPFNFHFGSPCQNFSLAVVPFYDWTRFGHVEERHSSGASLDIPCLTRWSFGLRTILGYHF